MLVEGSRVAQKRCAMRRNLPRAILPWVRLDPLDRPSSHTAMDKVSYNSSMPTREAIIGRPGTF
jgi:hypothetical protein